jgi:hypothetical protein
MTIFQSLSRRIASRKPRVAESGSVPQMSSSNFEAKVDDEWVVREGHVDCSQQMQLPQPVAPVDRKTAAQQYIDDFDESTDIWVALVMLGMEGVGKHNLAIRVRLKPFPLPLINMA